MPRAKKPGKKPKIAVPPGLEIPRGGGGVRTIKVPVDVDVERGQHGLRPAIKKLD